MPITGDTITIPAASSNTYWVTALALLSNPNGATTARATLVPYTQDQNGVVTLLPASVSLTIPDVFAAAGTDPTVAAAIAAIYAAVQSQAQAQGLI